MRLVHFWHAAGLFLKQDQIHLFINMNILLF